MKASFFLTFLLLSFGLHAQEDLNMTELFNWNDPDIPGTNQYDNAYNEIWGYAADGREYAIIGSTLGTHFFDVTDPQNTVEVDFVAGAAQGGAIVHRDYHDYAGYLYMACQEGFSTLQVADLSFLPDSVHVVYDSDEIFRGAHNIFIDESQARMYAMDVIRVGQGFKGLQIISLEDPENPVLLGEEFNSDVHDIFVRDHIGYLNRGSGSKLQVWDLSDAEDIQLLGELDSYPGQGYNHSGYLSEDGNTYLMGDETWGSPLKILDVSDYTDIQVITTMESGVNEQSIAHNQLLDGNIAWSSYYYDGVWAWDISDPENPILAGHFDTTDYLHTNNYEGCWGVYPYLPSGNILVSDMQYGLFVLSFDYTESVGEKESKAFAMFPNPAHEVVNIQLPEGQTQATLQLFDLQGRMLRHAVFQEQTQLDLADLPKGIYEISLFNDGYQSTQKLIVR